MTISKELLTHMQWYFTREVNRLQDFMSFPSEIYRYETYTKYLEEVRVALKEHESNTDLPWQRVIYCRRSS